MEEFTDDRTIKSLVKALKKDTVIPTNEAISTIEKLNELLKHTDLYGKIKEKKSQSPSAELEELEKSYNDKKNENNLKRLNRSALEEFYPQETPKSLNNVYDIHEWIKRVKRENNLKRRKRQS